jgi:hypothetical protein
MADIKELFDLIRDKRAESKIEPEDTDYKVRSGVEAIKRNAERALPDLELLYKEEVMKNVVAIGVSGPSSEEFANIAKYALKVLTIDHELLVNRITNSIKTRSPRPEFNMQEYYIFMDEINKIKTELGIIRLQAPQVNYYDGIYGFDIKEAVGKILESNYDQQLQSLAVRRAIGQAALNAEFVGKTLPVILFNYNGKIDETLLPRPITAVEVNGKVTEADVKRTLDEVKAKLKPATTKKQPKQETKIEEAQEIATEEKEQ